MISLEDIKTIQNEPIDKREKVLRLIDLTSKVALKWNNDVLSWVNSSYFDEFHFSNSIIEISDNQRNTNYLNDFILNQLDKQQTIHLIIDAINHICLKEDKQVFVERFILKDRMNKIKERHCLSNNGYYECLNRAINDCYSFIEENCR